MANDPDFLPSKMNKALEDWAGKGLQLYSQLMTNNVLYSFETIAHKFNLDKNDLFQYFQIRSYLMKQREEQSQQMHGLMAFINKNRNSLCSKISKLYKILQETKECADNTQEKWELELTTTISEEEWKEACTRIFKTTQSKYWKEFAWKINMKLFLTPLIKSKYSSSGSAKCWRECEEQEANHAHIFLLLSSVRGILEGSAGEN